jgi:chemotaxis protein histidine kinase CheA
MVSHPPRKTDCTPARADLAIGEEVAVGLASPAVRFMKFRDYAANETSLLISRLLAKRAKKSSADLQAFHQALEQTVQVFEATLATWAKIDHDEEVSDLIERLTAAAAAQAQALAQRTKTDAQTEIDTARKELTSAHKELEGARKELTSAHKELDAVRKELDEEANEKQGLAASLEKLRTQADGLRADCQTQKERAEASRAECAAAQEAHAAAVAAGRQAESARQQESKAKAAAESELKQLRAAMEANRADTVRLTKQLEHESAERAKLTSALEGAQSQVHAADKQRQTLADSEATLRQRVAEAAKEIERARAEVQTAAQNAAKTASALEKSAVVPLDRLLSVFQNLGKGTTIDEALTALADGLAHDFSRVALFRVKGNRLEGVHQVGFDFNNDISKLAIPMTRDSLLSHAVVEDRVEAIAARDLTDTTRLPFGGTPACVLALPIKLHDEALAVIYADDSDAPQTPFGSLEQKTKMAELLRRYAVPVLEKLTIDPKMLEELRAYATLLVDEVEHMYTNDVSAGKKGAELKSRVKANLDCARDMYAQRVASDGPAAAAVLDERLAAVMEARAGTPFGKDLAAAAAPRAEAPPKQVASRAAGQAS